MVVSDSGIICHYLQLIRQLQLFLFYNFLGSYDDICVIQKLVN